MIQFFNRLSDFTHELDNKVPAKFKQRERPEFTGWASFQDARADVYNGAGQDVLDRAAKLLDAIESDGLDTNRTLWRHAVTGYIPCVPSFLAGDPESMRMPVREPSNHAPIRVFASVCASAGISSSDLEKRGIAILALCQKLQATRPVELWVYAEMGGSKKNDLAAIPCIRLETAPLDLTTASYIMTHAGFLRQLCFSWAYMHGFDGQWAWYADPRSEESQVNIRKALNATDADLIVPGAYYSDPIVLKPLAGMGERAVTKIYT